MKRGLFIALFVINSVANAASANEKTQGITITGDREMPQVLYILPWQDVLTFEPPSPTLAHYNLRPVTPCDLDPNYRQQWMAWLNCPADQELLQWQFEPMNTK